MGLIFCMEVMFMADNVGGPTLVETKFGGNDAVMLTRL